MNDWQREAVDEALAPYREEAKKPNYFFEVEIHELEKDDLIALMFWIAEHSRNKKMDH